jgi:hypothetical protein
LPFLFHHDCYFEKEVYTSLSLLFETIMENVVFACFGFDYKNNILEVLVRWRKHSLLMWNTSHLSCRSSGTVAS